MGPLEKMRVFGLSPSDFITGLSAIPERLSTNWDKHAFIYDQAAEDIMKHYGGRTPEYNYAKGLFGGMDYALRTDRPKEEAKSLARLHQWKQSLFRDPTQDLLDLEANLRGLETGYNERGKTKPTSGPIYDQDNYWELIERVKREAEE